MTDETAKAILDLDDDNLQNVWDWVTGQMLDASHTRDFWADQRAMARLWLMRDELLAHLERSAWEGSGHLYDKITAIAGEIKDDV